MKKFLGIICLLYSGIISYVWIFDKLKFYLAPNMQMYIKISILPLIIMGIILLRDRNDKFKISDLVLLLPIIMIIISGDGRLSTSFASSRTTIKEKPKQVKKIENKKEQKEKEDEEDIQIDKDNLEIHFDVIDKNYVDLASYITFPGEKYNQYLNKTIRIRGMAVTNAEYTPNGYFQIGKYTITCCAADAQLANFYVKKDNNQIKDNSWYEIEGILKKMEYMNTNIMYIEIVNIKEIDSKNEEQYVYPCYSYDDGSCKEFLKYNLEY